MLPYIGNRGMWYMLPCKTKVKLEIDLVNFTSVAFLGTHKLKLRPRHHVCLLVTGCSFALKKKLLPNLHLPAHVFLFIHWPNNNLLHFAVRKQSSLGAWSVWRNLSFSVKGITDPHLLKDRLRKRMLCCSPGGSLVSPRDEQSTTRCPRLQEHTEGQTDNTQPPCSPHSSRMFRQSREAAQPGMVRALK